MQTREVGADLASLALQAVALHAVGATLIEEHGPAAVGIPLRLHERREPVEIRFALYDQGVREDAFAKLRNLPRLVTGEMPLQGGGHLRQELLGKLPFQELPGHLPNALGVGGEHLQGGRLRGRILARQGLLGQGLGPLEIELTQQAEQVIPHLRVGLARIELEEFRDDSANTWIAPELGEPPARLQGRQGGDDVETFRGVFAGAPQGVRQRPGGREDPLVLDRLDRRPPQRRFRMLQDPQQHGHDPRGIGGRHQAERHERLHLDLDRGSRMLFEPGSHGCGIERRFQLKPAECGEQPPGLLGSPSVVVPEGRGHELGSRPGPQGLQSPDGEGPIVGLGRPRQFADRGEARSAQAFQRPQHAIVQKLVAPVARTVVRPQDPCGRAAVGMLLGEEGGQAAERQGRRTPHGGFTILGQHPCQCGQRRFPDTTAPGVASQQLGGQPPQFEVAIPEQSHHGILDRVVPEPTRPAHRRAAGSGLRLGVQGQGDQPRPCRIATPLERVEREQSPLVFGLL